MTDPFASAWRAMGEPVCNLARMRWEDDGKPVGMEAEYVRRARLEFDAEERPPGNREAGTSGHDPAAAPSGLPRDPTELDRPLSEDEKVDEAALQSMDASDPPSFSGTGSGAPDHGRGSGRPGS
ncbi:hypothetical protein STVA_04880 [Allostella vacuolata]|nr:hypothetical protein STVA_04880 [Stella vacuolata]